jgi:hypothetical protein
VIAFDAHVLEWNLDDNPPKEYVRRRVKEASFYGKDTWNLDLVLKLDGDGDGKGALQDWWDCGYVVVGVCWWGGRCVTRRCDG